MTHPSCDDDGPFPRSRSLELWLQTEGMDEKARIDTLAGDAALCAAVKAANYEGPDWDFIAREIARYGLAVFEGWMARGIVTERCRAKGVRGVPSLPDAVRQDQYLCEEITALTVENALIRFRDKVLKKDVWDPERGASLRTFFIRQCMWHYGDAYKKVVAVRHRQIPTSDIEILDSRSTSCVEDDVIRAATATLIVKGATNERAARALAMDIQGYDHKAIAADMETTTDSVKSLLKRERARLRIQLTREDIA